MTERKGAARPRSLRSPALLSRGSVEHYGDPAYYEQTYRRRIDDVAFYVTRAQKSGGPVLEYGIGHGRVALPIARHGVAARRGCEPPERSSSGSRR